MTRNLILLLLVLATNVHAQPFQFEWSIQVEHGTVTDEKLAMDGSGNMYWYGHFEDSLDLDPGPQQVMLYEPDPLSGAFIAKYSGDGEYLWHVRFHSQTDFLDVMDLAIDDGEDRLAVVGTYQGAPVIGEALDTLQLADTDRGYVSMFSTDGVYEGSMVLGADISGVRLHTVMFTSDHSLVIGGGLWGNVNLDPVSGPPYLVSGGQWGPFAARYTPSFDLIWGFAVSGGSGYVMDMTEMQDNSIVLVGEVLGISIDLDPGSGNTATPAGAEGSGQWRGFVARYGQGPLSYQWSKIIGGAGVSSNPRLVLATDDGMVISGWYDGIINGVTFDADPGPDHHYLEYGPFPNYVIKLDELGNLSWATGISVEIPPIQATPAHVGSIALFAGQVPYTAPTWLLGSLNNYVLDPLDCASFNTGPAFLLALGTDGGTLQGFVMDSSFCSSGSTRINGVACNAFGAFAVLGAYTGVQDLSLGVSTSESQPSAAARVFISKFYDPGFNVAVHDPLPPVPEVGSGLIHDIHVFDISGRLVKRVAGPVDPAFWLQHLADLDDAVYVISGWTSDKRPVAKRFVKERD